MLSEEEKRTIDWEAAEILLDIKKSKDTEEGKLIEAFRAGVKWARENLTK